MKKIIKKILISMILSPAIILCGCQSIYGNYTSSHGLIDHHCRWVRHSAEIGLHAGEIVGMPGDAIMSVWVILFQHNATMEQAFEEIFFPSAVTGLAGEYALGGLSWCLFSWWMPDNDPVQQYFPEEEKTEHPTTATPGQVTSSKNPRSRF